MTDVIQNMTQDIAAGMQFSLNTQTYVCEAPISQGAFNRVWRVRRLADEQQFAAKFTQRRDQGNGSLYSPAYSEKVKHRRESELLFFRSLADDVEHVLRPEAIGYIDGEPVFVMPLCEGTLEEAFFDRQESLMPVHAPQQLLTWLMQIAQALATLNNGERAVLHRDIKPANVLLDKEGNAWLNDFDGVKFQFSENTSTQVGTPIWWAPELVVPVAIENNERRFKEGVEADLYGLGLIAYALITGDTPESANTLNEYAKSVTRNPEDYGQYGGLTAQEAELLTDYCKSLFGIQPKAKPDRVVYATIVGEFDGVTDNTAGESRQNNSAAHNDIQPLPQFAQNANSLSNVVQRLLQKMPEQRGSVGEAHAVFKAILAEQTPLLESLELSVPTEWYEDSVSSSFKLMAMGTGLPAQANWWEIECESASADSNVFTKVPLSAVNTVGEQEWDFAISSLPFGQYRLRASACVSGEWTKGEWQDLSVAYSATTLWVKGEKAAAICQDPNRPEWLKNLIKEASGKEQKAAAALAALQQALAKHPNNENLKQALTQVEKGTHRRGTSEEPVEIIDEGTKNTDSSTSTKKESTSSSERKGNGIVKRLSIGLLAICLVGVGIFVGLRLSEPQPDPKPKPPVPSQTQTEDEETSVFDDLSEMVFGAKDAGEIRFFAFVKPTNGVCNAQASYTSVKAVAGTVERNQCFRIRVDWRKNDDNARLLMFYRAKGEAAYTRLFPENCNSVDSPESVEWPNAGRSLLVDGEEEFVAVLSSQQQLCSPSSLQAAMDAGLPEGTVIKKRFLRAI